MTSRYSVHPVEQQFRDLELAHQMERLKPTFERLATRYSKPTNMLTCISCGAQGNKDQYLPCGH